MSEIKEVSDEIIGWQGNKVIRTVKYLTTKPGQVISEYCQGEKQRYLSPVVYYFGAIGLEYYLASVSGMADGMAGLLAKQMEAPLVAFGFATTTDKLNTAFSFLFNQTFGTIVSLPVILFITWLIFRRYNKSFKENSWFALYTTGHTTLLMLPTTLIWYIKNDLEYFSRFSNLFGIIVLLYLVWAAKQFYQIKLGRAILVILLLSILRSISVFIIIFSVLIFFLTFG